MRELRMSDPEYRAKMEEKERLALEREKKRQERATRNTLKYVPDKDRKAFASDLKTIYHASDEEKARLALDRVTEKWTAKYPNFMKRWYDNWDAITPIFKFSPDVRKVIYTTNAIESLNSTYRKLNRQRSVFPSDTALLKVLYLATFEATKKWTMSIPKTEFENVIMEYFNIDSDKLQKKTIYDYQTQTYEYKPRGFYEIEYPEYPYSEVVGYKEHSDGTITLNVHVIYPYAGDSNVYMHDVTVRPLSDRGFQYVSNYIVSEEENNNITWHTPRLTEDEWNDIYGEQ